MNSFNNNADMAFSVLSLININLLVNTIILLEREREREIIYILQHYIYDISKEDDRRPCPGA